MKRMIIASQNDPYIGIWWYTDNGQIIGESCPVDEGVVVGNYIQYSATRNHMNAFKDVINNFFKGDKSAQIAKGFRSLERGRVIFNTQTLVYEVTCSADIINDTNFRTAVINYFQLNGERVDFVALQHYKKVEYTGNPAIDTFIDNNEV